MELIAIKPVLEERFFKTVFVSAPQVNLNKIVNASTCQPVKLDSHGTEKHVLLFLVPQDLHSQVDAAVVKPQFTHAHQALIGMVIDAFISPTSAQLV